MFVLATAGHVDHGKSTLVRALTGIEPDRYVEERRRGMTIDLGFAWTTLDSGRELAFVDVPGHERFVPTMLAGVGPVPAVMFVVAADGGWMPQSAEHLDALTALGVGHGLLVITRADLADPAPALTAARAALARTPLAQLAAVSVSATTGAGLPELRRALDTMLGALPVPSAAGPVRLWLDRAFTITGAGTVVTGTLGAGTVHEGDEFDVLPLGRRVGVRAVQSAERARPAVGPVARVALNLRGIDASVLGRGQVLVTPGTFATSAVLDVRLDRDADLPATLTVHVGSAARPARVRPLAGRAVRLTLDVALPWHVGDVVLLRDPGAHRVLAGATVLDPLPPALRRRGAAAARATDLTTSPGGPCYREELRRRRLVPATLLRSLGVPPDGPEVVPGWHADPGYWQTLTARLTAVVAGADRVAGGVPVAEASRRLGLPDVRLLRALVQPPLVMADGRVRAAAADLPPDVQRRLEQVLDRLGDTPWRAPEAADLAAARLGSRELAAAVRTGRLEQVADGVYLRAGATAVAASALRDLPQPFTAADAKRAWGTTRRVAVPLLELLLSQGVTRRTADGRHQLR